MSLWPKVVAFDRDARWFEVLWSRMAQLATIVMYYTYSGSVPTAEDAKKAECNIEELDRAVEVTGNLADAEFYFVKSRLQAGDVVSVEKTLVTQPPPVSYRVMDAGIFAM